MAAQQQSSIEICKNCKAPTIVSKSETAVFRRAIDVSGRVGSLYDAQNDTILDPLENNFFPQSMPLDERLQYLMRKHDTDESPHWLKCITMHRELRLSIALKMIPAKGIATLAEYSRPINRYTRFMCCSYQ